MKLLSTVLSLTLSLTLLSTPALADDKKATAAPTITVNPYGKFFAGDGIEIEMAMVAEKNADGLHDVLLKISGAEAFDEGIDGKVFLYTAVPAGTGVDFRIGKGKDETTRMLSRAVWGTWKTFEVFLQNKTLNVRLDEGRSKDVRPLHLLTAYKKDGGQQ